MQNPTKQCLTLFATGLFLWLLWGFWSLGQTVTIFVSVLVLALTGGMLFWQYKQRRQMLLLSMIMRVHCLPITTRVLLSSFVVSLMPYF